MIRGNAASSNFKEEKKETDSTLPKPVYPPQTQIVRLAAPITANRVNIKSPGTQQLRVFQHKNGKLVSLANTSITPGGNQGTWLHNGKPITIVFDKAGTRSGQGQQLIKATSCVVVNSRTNQSSPVAIMSGKKVVQIATNSRTKYTQPTQNMPALTQGTINNQTYQNHQKNNQIYAPVNQTPNKKPEQIQQVIKLDQRNMTTGAGISYASHPSQHPSQPQPKQQRNQNSHGNHSNQNSQGNHSNQSHEGQNYTGYTNAPKLITRKTVYEGKQDHPPQLSQQQPAQISPPPPHLEYSQSSTGSTQSTSTEESTEDKKRRMYYKPVMQRDGQQNVSDTTLNLLWANNSVLNGIINPNKKRVQDSPHVERKRGRRSSEKGGKGLRHFSSKVCEKVQQKGVTTYVEVSEELVAEFADPANLTPSDHVYDSKNIRRRVYDALNVLFAMNIISKEKKEIRWVGLPTNSLQECHALEEERKDTLNRIKNKKKRAQELMLQLIAYRTLINRNKDGEDRTGPLPSMSTIQVPFIILSTGPNTEIGLTVSSDKTKYEFTFDDMFEIHDEFEILRKMGMCYGLDVGEYNDDMLQRAEELLPNTARPYLRELFPRKSEAVTTEVETIQPPPAALNPPTNNTDTSCVVKTEPPQTDIQRQALETFTFDAPPYSSPYDAGASSQKRAFLQKGQVEVANTMLSLVNVDQGIAPKLP